MRIKQTLANFALLSTLLLQGCQSQAPVDAAYRLNVNSNGQCQIKKENYTPIFTSDRVVRVYGDEGWGAGYVLDDGLVLTAAHVANHISKSRITNDEKEVYEAKVVATDSNRDLALLAYGAKSDKFNGVTISKGVKTDEQTTVKVNNPHGRFDSRQDKMRSVGNFDIYFSRGGVPGWSGSPVINDDGYLAGMVIGSNPVVAAGNELLEASPQSIKEFLTRNCKS